MLAAADVDDAPGHADWALKACHVQNCGGQSQCSRCHLVHGA